MDKRSTKEKEKYQMKWEKKGGKERERKKR